MKALVIGIDGGEKRILDFFNQPFYAELKSAYHSRLTSEDLFSRGWAEILTGQHGKDTHAFYMSPKLDGSHRFSESFHLSDACKKNNVKPIWEAIGEKGFKVGIMNVPTTTPAPEVNGFLVGSAGGGLSEIVGYPEELVYPNSIIATLEENDYIVDTRFKASGIRDIKELFARVIDMERRRTKTFIQLCQEQKTDFGFIVNTGVRTIQYLAMSEIEALMKQKGTPDTSNEEQNEMARLLEDLYYQLDLNIRNLVEQLKPEHVIITADHGQAPFSHVGNLDIFLEENGWLERSSASSANLLLKIQRLAKKLLPNRFKKTLQKKLPVSIGTPPPNFDTSTTKAFGHYYVSGIYINDSRRFGGPVEDGRKVDSLVDHICDTFNHNEDAVQYSMKAYPYRRKFVDSSYADYMPDILIEKPDSIFFLGNGAQLVRPNSSFGPLPENLNQINSDMYTGVKGQHPIMLMDKTTAKLLDETDPSNLTVVYNLLGRIFSN